MTHYIVRSNGTQVHRVSYLSGSGRMDASPSKAHHFCDRECAQDMIAHSKSSHKGAKYQPTVEVVEVDCECDGALNVEFSYA